MYKSNEKHIAASLAKVMAMMCVRNTKLEDIHAGVVPVSKTGDFSDVMIVDANGREIPWPEVSHFDDDAMRDLMRQIVNRLYTFQLMADDPHFQRLIDRWSPAAQKWDDPELDEFFMRTIERN
ncbi:MAG: hypothetical protein ISR53_03470 [Rhodospirillales bacterium]|nr:hypothetical protein [Rhodospirillales bacterium]